MPTDRMMPRALCGFFTFYVKNGMRGQFGVDDFKEYEYNSKMYDNALIGRICAAYSREEQAT